MTRNRWLWVVGRVLLGLAVVAGVFALWAFWPERARTQALAVPAGTYDVEILRDTYGVPHVFGRTNADVAFGLAYAHAEDDFLTIQQSLVAARGDLAYYYGADAAPNDFMVGLLRINERLDAQYERDISAAMRAVLDGYAAGLNHYASEHPDDTLPGAFPVTGRDVAAGFVHKTPLFFGLDGALGELFGDERRREVSERQSAAADATFAGLDFLFPEGVNVYGSNVLAVGPARSADGSTMLAVNSHQPWTGPVAWYEAHLRSDEGWEVAGGLFPGSPMVLHGHNRDVSWGFTVNSPDLIDIYVLDTNPDNPDQYRFDGEWRTLEIDQVPISVKLFGRFRWTVRQEIAWSVYGPTVRQPHGTYAIRYAAMDDVDFVETFYDLTLATDFDSWSTAVARMPTFNVGYADREGNIYYLYNGRFPVRSEAYDWQAYLPGDTAETLWTETLPLAERPQILNPPSGFLQNANSSPFTATAGEGNPDEAAFSGTLGIDTRQSNRALRALALFDADPSITAAEFEAIKFDHAYAPDADPARFIARLLANPPSDPALQPALELLAEWDLVAAAESRGATVALLTLYFLNQQDGVQFSASEMTESEVSDAALQASLTEAVAWLETHFGRLDVPWGEVNRLQRGAIDLPLAGGPDMLHAVYGSLEDGRVVGNAGDSYVMLVYWAPDGSVSSQSIHQFGSATLDETSPHYADQAALFAARELKPVWLDEAEIRANLSRAYRPNE